MTGVHRRLCERRRNAERRDAGDYGRRALSEGGGACGWKIRSTFASREKLDKLVEMGGPAPRLHKRRTRSVVGVGESLFEPGVLRTGAALIAQRQGVSIGAPVRKLLA
jgi:hypothetical protein